jgi:hypothetical protein
MFGRNAEDWRSRDRAYRVRAFSRTVPVTQRHAVDRHHLKADLRFSAAWTGLPEAHRSLVEVLVEAAASSACGHIMLELPRNHLHIKHVRAFSTQDRDEYSGRAASC